MNPIELCFRFLKAGFRNRHLSVSKLSRDAQVTEALDRTRLIDSGYMDKYLENMILNCEEAIDNLTFLKEQLSINKVNFDFEFQ